MLPAAFITWERDPTPEEKMMADPTDPEIPTAITDEPQAEAMQPVGGSDQVKKMTHKVDTDDMFKPGS